MYFKLTVINLTRFLTQVHNESSYNGFSLLQDLVVLAEGRQEDERGDVFETVNPLPTLRLLTAYVHNPDGMKGKQTFLTCLSKIKRKILELKGRVGSLYLIFFFYFKSLDKRLVFTHIVQYCFQNSF